MPKALCPECSGTAPPEGGSGPVPEGGQDVRKSEDCREVLQEQGQPLVSCMRRGTRWRDESCPQHDE